MQLLTDEEIIYFKRQKYAFRVKEDYMFMSVCVCVCEVQFTTLMPLFPAGKGASARRHRGVCRALHEGRQGKCQRTTTTTNIDSVYVTCMKMG